MGRWSGPLWLARQKAAHSALMSKGSLLAGLSAALYAVKRAASSARRKVERLAAAMDATWVV